MNVSRSSWHYRLHVFLFTIFNLADYGPLAYVRGERDDHQPKTLCGYFWSTLTLTALTPIWLPFMTFVVAPIMGVLFAGIWVHGQYRSIRPKPAGKTTKFDVAVQYTVARKQKYCPLISLTD